MKIYKFGLKKKFIKIFYNFLKNKGLFIVIKILNYYLLKKKALYFLKENEIFFFKFKIQRIKNFFPKNIQKVLISNLFFLCFLSFNSFFIFIKKLDNELKDLFLIYLIYYEKRILSIFYLKNLLYKKKLSLNINNFFLYLNNFKINLYFKIIKILILKNFKNLNLFLINGYNKSS